MTVVRGLYVRFQRLIHEAAKFGVVGIVGVFITNGGYALLHNTFGLGPVTATTIATIVATAISYVANRYWSFRHRERTSVAREGVIFFVLNGIGLLIQDAVVAFNFYILSNGNNKAAEFIALNVGIAIATLFRFWSYRKWVWAEPADGAEAARERAPAGAAAPSPPMAARSGRPAARAGPERRRPRARSPARERPRARTGTACARTGTAAAARTRVRIPGRPAGMAGRGRHDTARGQAAAGHRRYALKGLRGRCTPRAARRPGPAAAGRT